MRVVYLGLLLLAVACAHERGTSAPPPQPAAVTSAPVTPAPGPASPTEGNFDNGSVPDRTWGTGGVSEPGAGPGSGTSASPADVGLADAGSPRPPRTDDIH
jgi:hypothetical protein